MTAFAELINMLHDAKVMGEYLQSPHFSRAKYELFALHHMQMLVWLQRVQTGLASGAGKAGPEMAGFLAQIAHAARVILFQPFVLHVAQVTLLSVYFISPL